MNKRKKTYRIGFFSDEPPRRLGFTVLHAIAQGRISRKTIPLGNVHVGLRELHLAGRAYQGVIGEFRQSDLPVIAKIQGDVATLEEHAIDMENDEGLLEKTHFVLYKSPPLLLMRSNSKGPGVATLARYLSEVSEELVTFPPVLRRDAYRRIIRNDMRLRDINIKVARPRGVDFLREIQNEEGGRFSKEIFRIMNDSNAVELSMKMKAGMENRQSRALHNNIRMGVGIIFQRIPDTLKTAQFNMEDAEGKVHPIDLIADRLITKISVETEGRYPNTTGMFREMIRSKDREENEWSAFFQGSTT